MKIVLEHLGLTVNRLIRVAFGPFQLGDLVRVVACAADEESEVRVHAAGRAPDLVGKRLGRGRRRIGVWHLEDRRHAAQDG